MAGKKGKKQRRTAGALRAGRKVGPGDSRVGGQGAPDSGPLGKGADSPRTRPMGLVTQVMGPRWMVTCQGEALLCVVKRSMVREHGKPVVGDRVLIDPPSSGTSRIVDILPRTTVFSRPDVHSAHKQQLLAANADQLVIVASFQAPPLNSGLIDRYLVAAWKAGLDPLLCFNKLDLVSEDQAEATIASFRDLDIPLLMTSLVRTRGLEALKRHLKGRMSILVGMSGVGKTSLARLLLGDPSLRVGSVSEATGLGRHTTSSARLLPIPEDGGYLVDMPGQRVFGLGGLEHGDLLHGFPDLEALGRCELPACRHDTEPGCRVRSAVSDGRIAARRVRGYQRILNSLKSAF